jgi:thioredoxin reductase (NADPH)
MAKYEVIIIGGGPAGLTAGLYTSRAGLRSLLIERNIIGGQIINATLVENYPGFPQGISGAELGSLMHQQAIKYGLEIVTSEVTGVTPRQPYGVSTTNGAFEARGGGDTAITDALELTRHAAKVYVIHRRDQLRAGQLLQQRAFAEHKLEFIWSTVVEEILGEKLLSGLKLRNVKTGQSSIFNVAGIFIAVGLMPNSQQFSNILELDDTGYIVTNETMATSTPGIFAAGDIRRNSPRQIAAAVGDGATAAMSAFKYVQEGRS